MKHLVYIVLLIILSIRFSYSQIDCESAREATLGQEFDFSYSSFNTAQNRSILDLTPSSSFSTEQGDIYIVTLIPAKCHVEKFNSELKLLAKNTIEVEMSVSRTYFGIKQIGDKIYLVYSEKENKNGSKVICQLINPENLKLSEEKTVLFSSVDDIEFPVIDASRPEGSKLYLSIFYSSNKNFICFCIENNSWQNKNTQFLIKVVNNNLEEEYSAAIETGIKSEKVINYDCIVSDDGRVVIDVGAEFNPHQQGWDIATDNTRKLFLVSSTESTVSILPIQTETSSYLIERMFKYINGNKLYCFATMMKAGNKQLKTDYELLVYDFDSGELLKEIPTQLFNQLDAASVHNFNPSDKTEPAELSRELLPFTFKVNSKGDICLAFVGKEWPHNGIYMYPIAMMVIDSNFIIRKSDLFFSVSSLGKLFVQDDNFHLYGNSFILPQSAKDISYKESFRNNQDADKANLFVIFDIQYMPDGNYHFTDLQNSCLTGQDSPTGLRIVYHSKSKKYIARQASTDKIPVYKLKSFKIK